MGLNVAHGHMSKLRSYCSDSPRIEFGERWTGELARKLYVRRGFYTVLHDTVEVWYVLGGNLEHDERVLSSRAWSNQSFSLESILCARCTRKDPCNAGRTKFVKDESKAK